MAKLHLDRLKRQYEGVKPTGNNYNEMIKQIIDNNNSNVQKRIYAMNTDKWKKIESRYRPSRETRLVLPAEVDVIPKRAIQVRKVAEKGEYIRETLRDSLTKNLRLILCK